MNQRELAQHHLDTQAREIAEMKARKIPFEVAVAGLDITVFPNVYPGGIDSELMCAAIGSPIDKKVLDLCTGTGVIALKASQMGAAEVIGIDLNPIAVENSRANKQKLGLDNIKFLEGSLFEPVAGERFDLITINPPYTSKKAADKTEICFWDEDNLTTRRFFKQYKNYLSPGGEAFVGWADFSSMELLSELAESNGVELRQVQAKSTPSGLATFLVYQLIEA